VLGDPGDPRVGDNRVIRLFARALYEGKTDWRLSRQLAPTAPLRP
jgi:hypothetical protein